jgi:hypothetical protein
VGGARQVTATLGALPGSNFVISLTPDLRVLTAVGIACLVSTIAFSLGPAWTLSKPDLASGLKTAGLRSPKRRIRSPILMVSGQIALSLALLVAAALFVRAGAAAAIADPGYTLRDGLLVQTDLDMIGATRADGLRIYGDLVDRLRALPGVRAATVASVVPFGDFRDGRMVRSDSTLIFATYTVVGADYLETLGLTLLAGREFTRIEEQTAAASPVALVDQMLVERLFTAGTRSDRSCICPPVQTIWMTRPWKSSASCRRCATTDRRRERARLRPVRLAIRSAMTLRIKTEPGADTALDAPDPDAIRRDRPARPGAVDPDARRTSRRVGGRFWR